MEKAANEFYQVDQPTAYGIRFGDGDGRLGMLAMIPSGDRDAIDFKTFGKLLMDALPSYAVPRFLRIKTEFDTTPTFKVKKNPLTDNTFVKK